MLIVKKSVFQTENVDTEYYITYKNLNKNLATQSLYL